MAKTEQMNIIPFAAMPIMQVQLNLDLEKLIDFTLQIHNKDKKGSPHSPGSNRGGWQSKDVTKENDSDKRIGGTMASSIFLMMQGIQILRIHDVNEVMQGIRVFREITKN